MEGRLTEVYKKDFTAKFWTLYHYNEESLFMKVPIVNRDKVQNTNTTKNNNT